jgi:ribose 5-phosphate isomerase A
MKLQSELLSGLQWSDNIINKEAKVRLAQQIADKVEGGHIVGAGSGSTVYLALFAIAERIKKENLNVKVIPSSIEITMACSSLGIPVTNLFENKPDWAFDGADEVDPNKSLIKGRGGAMFKEKLLIRSSKKNYILVDESKMVTRLGSNFPVPVEVFPGALLYVESALREMGINDIALRAAKGKDGPIITENNNCIFDVRFDHIPDDMEQKIKSITGVIESGLFIGYNVEVLIAK